MARPETPILIDRMYLFVKWYVGRLSRFPRQHRYGLGARIEGTLYAILETLIEAQYGAKGSKVKFLSQANTTLEVLRFHTRLAHDLAVLPHASYRFASEEINALGKMVGGWIRHQNTPSGTD